MVFQKEERMNILFISLGCDKNLVDSEVMLGLLAAKGYRMVDDEMQADIIIVNTCCFIHDAKEESIQTILEMAQYKTDGRLKVLVVTGCLAQRYQQEILDEIPEVDAVLGTTSYDKIVEAVEEALAGKGHVEVEDIDALPLVDTRRLVTTGGHFAYLKIAEGCDKHCTYCIIPKIRGDFRSVPMERLVKEAGELAEQGVKELILVAQETTLYGKDLYGEKSLHRLLRELCRISGIRWIRLLYCYPEEIDENLIQIMKEEKKICHYLDLPIQHANDDILKRMGRRTSKNQLEEIIGRLRREIPDIALRTTLITGFPGETKEQHEELMEFVDEMEFDRLGVFTYSPEEDTPAAGMPDQVPEEVKEERQAEIMELQQEIVFDQAEAMIGREVLVMIEGKVADENAYVGRTYKDAPNVDGLIFINTEAELMSGDFARVKVTGALEYDLIGELME
ncbi:ribosomal protein S12 methylthiotransferase RimO [[Clostridium] scindens ATCC 35704]|nr:ribosomal protein S12 methylthiotransferase RimO [[Clostridium] scindens ATCC 35704]